MTATLTDPVRAADAGRPRGRRRKAPEPAERAIVSDVERHGGRSGWAVRLGIGFVVVLLVVVSGGPLLWMLKASVSTSQEILGDPLGWPAEMHLDNYSQAWRRVGIAQYTLHSIIITTGVVIVSVGVSALLAYVLSVLRPRWAKVLEGAVLATLFVPGVISLVPLYLTVVRLGIIDSYWAIWLPAGAHAFNVMLILQFMRRLPQDVLDAARVDGAGPWRALWWVVLPMSRPILGGVALMSFVNSWKDYLWPLLVLPSPDLQPLAVGLAKVAPTTDKAVLMAGLVIAVFIPVAIFLIFQKQFLSAAGSSGALKG